MPMAAIQILVPTEDTLKHFAAIIERIFSSKRNVCEQVMEMKDLDDILLKRLAKF